jgi:hypothetical protein
MSTPSTSTIEAQLAAKDAEIARLAKELSEWIVISGDDLRKGDILLFNSESSCVTIRSKDTCVGDLERERGQAIVACAELRNGLNETRKALAKIESLTYGYDGDCGAVAIASDAIIAADLLLSKTTPGQGWKSPEQVKLMQLALEEVELHYGGSFSGTTKDQVNRAISAATEPTPHPAAVSEVRRTQMDP